MQKDKIIKTAFDLFAHYGIKIVSMDEIADALQISKKTLYVNFENKEDILCSCIDRSVEQVRSLLDKVKNETTNPVWKVALMTSDLIQYHSYFCPSFFRDMSGYPVAAKKFDAFINLIVNEYNDCLRQGQEEGYFLEEVNTEMISDVILIQLPKQKTAYRRTAAFTFLRGMCTEKGMGVFNLIAPEKLSAK